MTNPFLIATVALMGASAFFWVIALRVLPLSLAYPAASSSYILVAVASHFVFHEGVPVMRWVGMAIIATGIFVMFRWS
jgi:undecaprenyl phosphate-alpha-L-ara4N flippase subunit ArnE